MAFAKDIVRRPRGREWVNLKPVLTSTLNIKAIITTQKTTNWIDSWVAIQFPAFMLLVKRVNFKREKE